MRGLRCHLHLRWPQKGRRRFVEMNMELLVRIAFRSLKRRACANVHKLYEMSVHSLMAPTQPVRRSGKKLDFCCFWPLRAPKRRLSAARARPRAPSRPSPGAQTHLHSRETAPRAPRSTRSTKSGLAASPRDALPRLAIGASSLRRLICASSRRSPGMSLQRNRHGSRCGKTRTARMPLRDFPENAGAELVPAPDLGHAGYEVVAHVLGVARGLVAPRRGSDDDLEMLSAQNSLRLGSKQLVRGCAVVSRRPITAGAFGRGHRGHGALARRLAAAWATARRRTGVPHCKQREPPGVHRGPARRPPGLAGGPRVHGAHGEAPPRPCDARAPERAMLLVTKRL